MTTWGDGIFERHRDLDADGGLVQIRIEPGTDQRQKHLRQLELRTFTSAIVSKKIIDEHQPVRFMYREAPDREQDSGWRMLSGLETPQCTDNAENIAIVPLSAFAEMDQRVDKLLDEPIGSAFERRDAMSELEPVTDWTPSES